MSIRTLLIFLALSVGAYTSLYAQFSKTVHNSFEADSAQQIQLDLIGEVEVVAWAGNTVLVENNIRLYNASKGVFHYFVEKQGRYNVEGKLENNVLTITSTHRDRKLIQTKNGQAREEVRIKVMIPETFIGSGQGPYERKDALEQG